LSSSDKQQSNTQSAQAQADFNEGNDTQDDDAELGGNGNKSFLEALNSWRAAADGVVAKAAEHEENNNNGNTGMGTSTTGGSGLLDGAYDEAESRRGFLDALNEWRRGLGGGDEDKSNDSRNVVKSMGQSTEDGELFANIFIFNQCMPKLT
jgi:hypothetical protein